MPIIVNVDIMLAKRRHLIASPETFWSTGPVKRRMKNERNLYLKNSTVRVGS